MKELHVLKILNVFFKVATFTFAAVTFSFEVGSNGMLWIMWRDATGLALAFLALSGLMGIGWWYTARRRKASLDDDAGDRFVRSKVRTTGAQEAYNIWREMNPSARALLALAVFALFATIGPLSVLMESRLHPVTWQHVLITTIASGGISASIVLFGNRKWLMIAGILFFTSGNSFNKQIEEFLTGRPVITKEIPETGTTALDGAAYAQVRDQRLLIGWIAILLLTTGYVFFIVMLSKEGGRRARLETEMTIAQNIQESLLPSEMFATSWCKVAGTTLPASAVGGDYFDIIKLSGDRVVVVVADVAGHGIGAGILSAMTKSALHSQLEHDASPVAVMENLNTALYNVTEKNMFVTFGYVVLDWHEKQAHIATAGHPAILLRNRNGTLQEVRTQSMGLGMQRQGVFSEVAVPIALGDSLFLYTDGVTEAANAKGEQFSIDNLMKLASTNDGASPDTFCANVISAVKEFSGKNELKDDATIVCIKLQS